MTSNLGSIWIPKARLGGDLTSLDPVGLMCQHFLFLLQAAVQICVLHRHQGHMTVTGGWLDGYPPDQQVGMLHLPGHLRESQEANVSTNLSVTSPHTPTWPWTDPDPPPDHWCPWPQSPPLPEPGAPTTTWPWTPPPTWAQSVRGHDQVTGKRRGLYVACCLSPCTWGVSPSTGTLGWERTAARLPLPRLKDKTLWWTSLWFRSHHRESYSWPLAWKGQQLCFHLKTFISIFGRILGWHPLPISDFCGQDSR